MSTSRSNIKTLLVYGGCARSILSAANILHIAATSCPCCRVSTGNVLPSTVPPTAAEKRLLLSPTAAATADDPVATGNPVARWRT